MALGFPYPAYVQPLYGTRGTRHLRLRRSRGPSVFGPVQLLRLAVIFLHWTHWEASPDLLVKIGEERKKSRFSVIQAQSFFPSAIRL